MRPLSARSRFILGSALASILGAACSSSTPSNDLTCGTGTHQDGNQCLSDTTGQPVGPDGGTQADGSVPPDGTATPTAKAPNFAGVTSVAPAALTSLQVTWNPAKDDVTPAERLVYNVYVATSAGAQNFSAPTATTPPGATSILLNTVTANTTYYVVVRAVNEAKVEDDNKAEQNAKTQADTAPPTFAGAASAEPAEGSSLKVSWPAATDDLTPGPGMTYLVYLASSPGAEDLSGPSYVSDVGATSLVVKGLPNPSTTYYAIVRARDAAGNMDTNKVEVSGKTGTDTKPPVFSGCTSATVKDASSITVTWNAASDDTTPANQIVYDVFASKTPGGEDFTTPTQTFTTGTMGVVQGLTQATTYYVVCRARDLSNNSDTNKSERTATTLSDGVPPTFAGLTSISNQTATTVDLNWAAATDDQTAQGDIVYDVYQASAPGGEVFTQQPTATSNAGATSITISGLTSATQYYWVVRARDRAGNHDANTVEKGALTDVSFVANVMPIFGQHCAVSGCHVPGNPPYGLVLIPPSVAYGNIYNVASQEVPSSKRVVPSSSATSYLYKKIVGPVPFGEIMPPAAANDTLTTLEKDIIKNWIDQGAQQN